MKWSESDTSKLIELYHMHPCIWMISSVEYKNKAKRQEAYNEIVNNMNKEGFGVPELKQKIKNLRCTYHQEVMKIKKSRRSGAGAADIYVPQLKWFSHMDSFMKNIKREGVVEDNLQINVSKVSVTKVFY